MLKAFLLIAYGACLGYAVNNYGWDQKVIAAIERAYEDRVRRDAQIIRNEMTKGSYERSIMEPNQQFGKPIASS